MTSSWARCDARSVRLICIWTRLAPSDARELLTWLAVMAACNSVATARCRALRSRKMARPWRHRMFVG
jgi:hypothetical protein